jgi:hypothetical protein
MGLCLIAEDLAYLPWLVSKQYVDARLPRRFHAACRLFRSVLSCYNEGSRIMEAAMSARKSMLSALFFLALLALPALSSAVTVPNGSFESPSIPNLFPYVSLAIDNWQRESAPDYWTAGFGYSTADWNNCTGAFLNLPFDGQGNPAPPIDNVDGTQAVFMFPWPGQGLWQNLDATFEVGKSYQLTVSVQGGGTMPLNVPLEIRLFYEDVMGNHAAVGNKEILNTNPPNTKVIHLPEYTLDVPIVMANDLWAGENIGVEIISTAGMDVFNTPGYQQWEFDNVRLTAVPEPGSIALLAVGLGVFMARRWRASKK